MESTFILISNLSLCHPDNRVQLINFFNSIEGDNCLVVISPLSCLSLNLFSLQEEFYPHKKCLFVQNSESAENLNRELWDLIICDIRNWNQTFFTSLDNSLLRQKTISFFLLEFAFFIPFPSFPSYRIWEQIYALGNKGGIVYSCSQMNAQWFERKEILQSLRLGFSDVFDFQSAGSFLEKRVFKDLERIVFFPPIFGPRMMKRKIWQELMINNGGSLILLCSSQWKKKYWRRTLEKRMGRGQNQNGNWEVASLPFLEGNPQNAGSSPSGGVKKYFLLEEIREEEQERILLDCLYSCENQSIFYLPAGRLGGPTFSRTIKIFWDDLKIYLDQYFFDSVEGFSDERD